MRSKGLGVGRAAPGSLGIGHLSLVMCDGVQAITAVSGRTTGPTVKERSPATTTHPLKELAAITMDPGVTEDSVGWVH